MQLLILAVCFLAICLVPNNAVGQEKGQVSYELQQVYDHFTGKNFQRELSLLTHSVSSSVFDAVSANDVSVRLNGGGANNKLFVGSTNVIEILFKSSSPLQRFSIAFHFTLYGGAITWVTGYGEISSSDGNYPSLLKQHLNVNRDLKSRIQLSTHDLSDNSFIITGGVNQEPLTFPTLSISTVVFSLQVDVPADVPLGSGRFCVDNVLVPPSDGWVFGFDSANVLPTFQDQQHNSTPNPSAPPVCFDVVRKECYSIPMDPSISMLTDIGPDLLTVDRIEKHPSVKRRQGGAVFLRLSIEYDGDLSVLKDLGIEFPDTFGRQQFGIYCPIERLPELSATPGVKRLMPSRRARKVHP